MAMITVDEAVALAYRQGTNKQAAALAAGVSRKRLYQHALGMGLVGRRKASWSAAEMDVLRGNAHKSAAAIQRALACAGFSRSIGAIEERRRLTIGGVAAAREDADLMTTRELGDLLGVSDETVARWIKRKDLAATLATDVGNFSHGTYLITRAAVRRFVLSHAVRLPAQGVDLVWLVDLLRGA